MRIKKLSSQKRNPSEILTTVKDGLDLLKNRHPEITNRAIAQKLNINDSLISHVLSGKTKSKWLLKELLGIIRSYSKSYITPSGNNVKRKINSLI